ncbi:hypothetical protein AAFF39_05310 [Lactococcus garvieae]
MAYYMIPFFSSSVVHAKKKKETKALIEATLSKLLPNKFFEVSLIAKDFLLKEKMSDMAETMLPAHQESGRIYLNEVTERITKEMEIPYQYVWLVGINLSRDGEVFTFKELVKNLITKQTRLLMEFFNYRVRAEDTWAEDWKLAEVELRQKFHL